MGFFDSKSSSNTTNNIKETSGANQVQGNDNVSLSGVDGSVRLTNISSDRGSIDKAFDFATGAVDKTYQTMSRGLDVVAENGEHVLDTAERLGENGMAAGLHLAENQSGFLSDIFSKSMEGITSTYDNAFDQVGETAKSLSISNSSESSRNMDSFLKYGIYAVAIVGGVFALKTLKGK